MAWAQETEILDAATEALHALPGVRVTVKREHRHATDTATARNDAIVGLETTSGKQWYLVEVKDVSKRTLGGVLAQLHHDARLTQRKPLLVTYHAPEDLIDVLLEERVEFVDTAGNMYLASPAYHALVRGKPPAPAPPADPFTPTGLKVLYVLLAFPQLRQGTYRNLAEVAGVGLGSVSRTVNSLLRQGHLIKGRSGDLHVADFLNLLERWELGYLEAVRPKLEPTGWRFTSIGREQALQTLPEGVLVGGEEAAAYLTGHLKPQTLTLHAPKQHQQTLCVHLRLLPERETPDLYLLAPLTAHDRYKPAGRPTRLPLVHPILVRAELLALGGDRLREVATKLLEDVVLPEEARA